jgi:hypothetical protein
VGLHGNLGYRVNTEHNGFEAGGVLSYDLAGGYRLYPSRYARFRQSTWVLYLELNGTVSGEDEVAQAEDPDSGGHVLFLSPDLQWVPLPLDPAGRVGPGAARPGP